MPQNEGAEMEVRTETVCFYTKVMVLGDFFGQNVN